MKVLLFHSLKPPSETRIFEKLGRSIADISGSEIRILGCQSIEALAADSSIELRSPFSGKRGFLPRIKNIFKLWFELKTFEPDILIVCSPDLIIPAVLYRLTHFKKIVFDLQENFSLNILHQATYSGRFRIFFAESVEVYLNLFFKYFDRIWLAEGIYKDQFCFPVNQVAIFENRVPAAWQDNLSSISIENRSPGQLNLLFCGFITRESGILKAIRFFDSFNFSIPSSHCTIAGYIPEEKLRIEIEDLIKKGRNISLINGGKWISSNEIQNEYEKADAVISSYHSSPANLEKHPTKYFESFFTGKPVLFSKEAPGYSIIRKYEAGIEVDFSAPENNNFSNLKEQILSFQSKTKGSSDFVFKSERLKNEILVLFHRRPSEFPSNKIKENCKVI